MSSISQTQLWGRELPQTPFTTPCVSFHKRMIRKLPEGFAKITELALRIAMTSVAIFVYLTLGILALCGSGILTLPISSRQSPRAIPPHSPSTIIPLPNVQPSIIKPLPPKVTKALNTSNLQAPGSNLKVTATSSQLPEANSTQVTTATATPQPSPKIIDPAIKKAMLEEILKKLKSMETSVKLQFPTLIRFSFKIDAITDPILDEPDLIQSMQKYKLKIIDFYGVIQETISNAISLSADEWEFTQLFVIKKKFHYEGPSWYAHKKNSLFDLTEASFSRFDNLPSRIQQMKLEPKDLESLRKLDVASVTKETNQNTHDRLDEIFTEWTACYEEKANKGLSLICVTLDPDASNGKSRKSEKFFGDSNFSKSKLYDNALLSLIPSIGEYLKKVNKTNCRYYIEKFIISPSNRPGKWEFLRWEEMSWWWSANMEEGYYTPSTTKLLNTRELEDLDYSIFEKTKEEVMESIMKIAETAWPIT